MRHAARQPKEDPAPERADLDAKAVQVLDGQAELIARATAMLDRCPDPALLRQLVTEVISWNVHTDEMREELARYTVANSGGDAFFAQGRAYERSLQAAAVKAAVPGQHRRAGKRMPGPGQLALVVMDKARALVLPAAAASWAALKVLGKHARHAPVHGAGIKLTTLKAAALATAIPAAGALAITGAVVFSHPSGAHGSGPGQGAAPAATAYAAVPVPSLPPSIAAFVTHPKGKHAGRGKPSLSAAAGLPLLYGPAPQPSSSSPLSSPAPVVQASVSAGPAQLSLGGVTSLDLSLVPQATITLSASGSGWVSWRIDTTGTDLDFSATHGVLQAGQSVTITVSVDPAQALDGNVSQTFGIDGQQVTVSLPPLVPAVVPSPVASVLPSVIPSGL